MDDPSGPSRVIRSTDVRAGAQLGLKGLFYIEEVDGTMEAWDHRGGGLRAVGSAAYHLAGLAQRGAPAFDAPPRPPGIGGGSTLVTEQPPLLSAAEAIIPAIEPNPPVGPQLTPALALGMPAEGESPRTWLGRSLDLNSLREIVLTSGLASSESARWAEFALSLGFELPPPGVDPGSMSEGGIADGTPAP